MTIPSEEKVKYDPMHGHYVGRSLKELA